MFIHSLQSSEMSTVFEDSCSVEKNFIHLDEVKKLTCSVCFMLFKDPIMLHNSTSIRDDVSCCHRFCYNCIVTALSAKEKCPICRKMTQRQHIIRDAELARQVCSLEVKCLLCSWKGDFGINGKNFEKHMNECEPPLVECRDCYTFVLKDDFTRHVTVECLLVSIPCRNSNLGCNFHIRRIDMDSHCMEHCFYRLVACRYHDHDNNPHLECIRAMTLDNLEQHMIEFSDKHLSLLEQDVVAKDKQISLLNKEVLFLKRKMEHPDVRRVLQKHKIT